MRSGPWLLLVAAGLAVAVAGVLSRIISPPVGWSFLGGATVGGASFAALALRVYATTATSRLRRILGGLLRGGYSLVLVGVLYLLIVVGRADVLSLLIGYTYALIVFVITMAGSRWKRSGQPPVGGR